MLLKPGLTATIGLPLAMLLAGTANAHSGRCHHYRHHRQCHRYTHRPNPFYNNGHDKRTGSVMTSSHDKDKGHDQDNGVTK